MGVELMDQDRELLVGPVDSDMEEMLKAGIHLGHTKSKFHPSMAPFVFGVRNSISLLDLVKTKEKLVAASEFIKNCVAKKGVILLVGTRPAAKKVIRDMAERSGMPYFTERWIGGMLTNFKTVSKRIETLEKLHEEKRTGGFEKYTKKERMKKEDEIARLEKFFGGVRGVKKLPDALFVVDVTHDTLAVEEARKMRIPVVAFVDTNSNANLVDWPIPSNDDALPAIRYMGGRILRAIEDGLRVARATAVEAPEAPPASA